MCGVDGDFARLRFSLGGGEGVKWQSLESERRRPRWVETSKPYREEDLMKKLLTIVAIAAAVVAVPLAMAQNAGQGQPTPQQGEQAAPGANPQQGGQNPNGDVYDADYKDVD